MLALARGTGATVDALDGTFGGRLPMTLPKGRGGQGIPTNTCASASALVELEIVVFGLLQDIMSSGGCLLLTVLELRLMVR